MDRLIERLADKLNKKKEPDLQFDEVIVRALSLPIAIAIVLSGFYLGFNFLYTPQDVKTMVNEGILTAFIICIIVFFDRFVSELIEKYLADTLTKRTRMEIDDQIVILTKKVVRLIIWTVGLVLILSNLGYDVKTLLTGLGIGGLAIALASQNLVSNLIGGFIIITDKPFKIGNWINFSGGTGIVEDIGVRSTKIRSTDNSVIVVPNSKLVDETIQNVPSKNRWKVSSTIGLTYNTSSEDLKKAMSIIKNILLSNPYIEKEPMAVYFKEYGDWSLNIQIVYYIKNNRRNGYQIYINTINEINLKIKEEFDKANLEFAFPTQTIYLKKDDS